MALRYTTVQGFLRFMGYNESIMDFQPGNTPSRETVAASPVTAGDYYLDQLGVNKDTLKLYAGSTQLTVTTHYTFDSDTSKVTITSAGATALSGEDLDAEYEYSALGKDLSFNESERLLQHAEDRLHREVGTVFADQSSSTPQYLAISDESKKGGGHRYVHYDTDYYPLIKLATTVDGAYTTGGATLSLADGSGFPSAGTIYVGGNKVSYTSKSGDDLTVPTDTPSISDGATVRGEVIEVSTATSGTTPSYIVLTPDTSYAVDYETGEVQLQDSYYYDNETLATDDIDIPQFGTENRFRVSYLTAWREPGQDASVPEEIEELCYNMAGLQLLQRTILKSNTGQRDNFSPGVIQQMRDSVESQLRRYRSLPSRRL